MGTHEDDERYRYRITFSVQGRVRFLSHLEIQDTLLQAVRRTGVPFALSLGMKPKPVIKLALPRPVAVEGWREIADVDLAEPVDSQSLALSLTPQLPDGMELIDVELVEDGMRSAASRVVGMTYRIWVLAADGSVPERSVVGEAVERFLEREELSVRRVTPKQNRDVDVRGLVGGIALLDEHLAAEFSHPGVPVRMFVRLTDAGSVKPDEVVTALSLAGGVELAAGRIAREAIALADGAGRAVEPALVGADVPDGPAKPWGAC